MTSSAPSARWGAVALARLARAVEPGTEVEVRWSDGSGLARVEVPPLA
ncbi:MAG: hypothetical protein AB7L84_16430 [Acidimicrobiia bacterium]